MSKKIRDENGKTYVEVEPFHKKKWFVVIAAIVVIGLIGSNLGGDKDSGNKSAESSVVSDPRLSSLLSDEDRGNDSTESWQDAESWRATSKTPVSVEVPKEYIMVTADQMIQDLQNNALKAQSIYKGGYFEISGKLSTVDSSGKYIGIDGVNSGFSFVSILCDIKSEEQKNIVAELSKGQNVIIRGKVTMVGEVLGYSIDIDEIIPQ